jgi:hypothetical protein
MQATNVQEGDEVRICRGNAHCATLNPGKKNMAGWLRGTGALAGWARCLGRWARPAASGGGFLTCQYQLALGGEVQAILASDVFDNDVALTL